MNLKGLLKTIAPALGAAIGGPFGGIAAKLIAAKLGKDEPKNEGSLLKMVESAMGDPEHALALKNANNDFLLQMESLGVDVFKEEVKDRGDARDLAKIKGILPQLTISVVFITAFAVVCYVVFSQSLDLAEYQKNIIMLLLGILSAAINQIMNFWFGSSEGSKRKTELQGGIKL